MLWWCRKYLWRSCCRRRRRWRRCCCHCRWTKCASRRRRRLLLLWRRFDDGTCAHCRSCATAHRRRAFFGTRELAITQQFGDAAMQYRCVFEHRRHALNRVAADRLRVERERANVHEIGARTHGAGRRQRNQRRMLSSDRRIDHKVIARLSHQQNYVLFFRQRQRQMVQKHRNNEF